MKSFLNVKIARSDALARWLCGSTNWYVAPVLSICCLTFLGASFSIIFSRGLKPQDFIYSYIYSCAVNTFLSLCPCSFLFIMAFLS